MDKQITLSKQLSTFTYRNGLEISRVFDDFLRYVIWLHYIPEYGHKLDNWPYTPEQSKEFFGMYQTLVLTMQEELKHREWFDPFGHIYEDLIAGKSRRSNAGQFFTPEGLCDLMAEISNPSGEPIVGKRINDCACGSGRTLLAFHVRNLGNYYVAEDIDRTCAMMCVCNFILHGVKGEVIWHNSLFPDKHYGAWKVNEKLNKSITGYSIPHCREIGIEELSIQTDFTQSKKSDISIKEKLQTSAEKQLAILRELRNSSLPSKERKRQATLILKRYKQIKELIKKYELQKDYK